ncbi:hypothetical protein ABIC07_008346, partial [Bradyrhizobium sp. RT9a]
HTTHASPPAAALGAAANGWPPPPAPRPPPGGGGGGPPPGGSEGMVRPDPMIDFTELDAQNSLQSWGSAGYVCCEFGFA